MVSGRIHWPDGSQQVAALVVAPGAGYHMDMPLIAELASRVPQIGAALIRFNWHYFDAKLPRSADSSSELEDLRAVVDYVRALERVDRVLLGGKSLGTIVAYAADTTEDRELPLVLLTPVCRSRQEFARFYPQLAERAGPVLIQLGNQDPLCRLDILYASAGAGTSIVVLPGDHALEVGVAEHDAENIELAVSVVMRWLRDVL